MDLPPALEKGWHAQTQNRQGHAATSRQLNKLIEEATVDCYNEEEQATGFFTLIEQNLALPFATRVLGVEVAVVAVEIDDDGGLKVVCEHGRERQRIALTDLPLPSPLPAGAEWIAAYRCWVRGTSDQTEDEE